MPTDWVVLELTNSGEEEDPEVLRKALAKALKGGEIFIPASISLVGDSRVVHKLVDNYAFVRRTFSDSTFLRLEGSKYVFSILTIPDGSGGPRRIAGVLDRDIEKMRKQIQVETEQGIEVNDDVEVMSGPYRGIVGRVIEDIPEEDSVQVFIKLRSKKALVTLPRSFLRFVSKSTPDQAVFSPFLNKITRIQGWVVRARPVAGLKLLSIEPIEYKLHRVNTLTGWVDSIDRTIRFMRNPKSADQLVGPDGLTLNAKYKKVRGMTRLIRKNPAALCLYRAHFQVPILTSMYEELDWKRQEVLWLQDVVRRLASIQESVEQIERSIPDWKPSMTQNIIIDGHNLAYRVINAFKGVSGQLSTSEGDPTTLVYGFLNSLSSLKKRFDRATFYVVWDGSKQRRASIYPEYKAQRSSSGAHEMSPQMSVLREILSFIGVKQAYNPQEETDDLIACLVKKHLKGSHNLIVSTDRDFLQLVTYTDLLLVPKVGTRQEIIYDPDKVMADYGVSPSKITHLRALVGDTSDNFKGIERVPRKLLAALINTHGSLEGLLASNLSGTTKSQYEKIRAFESQARLYLQLMTLQVDVECPITEATPNVEEASLRLSKMEIQSDSILSPFFAKSGHGFVKTN